MSLPRKRMDPVSVRVTPVTALKRVDLPEPLGPITPVIRCGQITKFALLSACTPPKRTETSLMVRIGESPFAPPCSPGNADGVFGLSSGFGAGKDVPGSLITAGSGAANPNAD